MKIEHFTPNKFVILEYENNIYLSVEVYHEDGKWYMPLNCKETIQISDNYKILEFYEIQNNETTNDIVNNYLRIKYPEYFI